MQVTVIGTGYVGLVTAIGLADAKHEVVCVDLNKERMEQLSNGVAPITEEGIEEALQQNKRRLTFTTEYPVSDLYLVAVGTPERADGSCDLSAVEAVVKLIHSIQPDAAVVMKSTIPPGTTEKLQTAYPSLRFAMVPEFLREGTAIRDMRNPHRVIIGTHDQQLASNLTELFKTNAPIVHVDPTTAELTKYAANSFLAVKISFINEIARLADIVGADVEDVAHGIGLDPRIGPAFLKAGAGYGGSCFPKDIAALTTLAHQQGEHLHVIEAADRTNEAQLQYVLDKINPSPGLHVALLGLAFKPGTDDLRDAPALRLAERLMKMGVIVTGYDPAAKTLLDQKDSIEEAVAGADLAVIMTEWDEIKQITPKLLVKQMKSARLVDGRNCWAYVNDPGNVQYEGIGRPNKTFSNNQTF
ncbi:nucleotide sugar dehydrogenase [Exiguobacterium sp. KRL4]|uniref:UDP-glucose dehydrogenase family protein n=1 Tax=Exiguobacterium sp. KRL4 TaxID=1914536 RepID=UPI0008F941D3|nr:UDP-glucose/GDP-mannose dehydrogenase family protein [Exiguobacterium sp. KRL4]OIN66798.1 nucleotide sugar dehydrogenase [Exiguobacterium sp. KRL4]